MTEEPKDLNHDPAVRQLVQSPANTMEERYDARCLASDPMGALAQESRTLRRGHGLFKPVPVTSTRALRSRR